MKELDPISQDKNLDSIELYQQEEEKREIKLIKTERKIRGHILWEFNERTRKLNRAKFRVQKILEITSFNINEIKFRDKIDIKENCYYFQALNYTNALKRLKKKGYEIDYRQQQ